MADTKQRNSAGFEISTGQAAFDILHAQQGILKRLIALEADATYDAPEITCWRLRGYLKDWLRPPIERIGRRYPRFRSMFANAFLRWIYPSTWFDGWTLKQERAWAWSDTLKVVERSQVAVALIDGRLVAVIGYKLGGKMADGREIFEITKSSTLPSYRKRGINRLLRDAIIELVAERHGSAPVMSFSRNPYVIQRCQTLGWRELSLEQYTEILERIGRSGPPVEFITDFKHRWRAFLSDPQAVEILRG